MVHPNIFQITSLFIIFSITVQISSGQVDPVPYVECIDIQSDFERHQWLGQPDFKYAKNFTDLPSIVNQPERFDVNGIFYLEGTEFHKTFRKPGQLIANVTPSYIYLKHSRFETYQRYPFLQPFVLPSIYYDGNYFEKDLESSQWSWNEIVLPINMEKTLWTGLEVGAYFYQPGGYFLVDKIILVQGATFDPYYDVDKIAALCPESIEPTTTTENPSEPFKCSSVGYFEDPQDCTAFHQCYEGQGGALVDAHNKCGVGTVWCQKNNACAYQSNECPCNSS